MCQDVSSINVKFAATHRRSVHDRESSIYVNVAVSAMASYLQSPVKGPGLANGRHLLLGVCPDAYRKQKVGDATPMQAHASSFLRNLVK